MSRSVRLVLVSSLVIASTALGGCLMPEVRSPATGAAPTGEPLAIVDDVRTWTTTYKEKVGETVYKDSSGRTVGTADTYQDRTAVHSVQVWYPVQGGAQLDDEDFFRIAGDQASFARTQELRTNAIAWNHRGKVIMGVGVVAAIAGLIVPYATKSAGTLPGTLLLTTGSLGISVGAGLAFWGSRQISPDNHAVDRGTAERAAQTYNTNLRGPAGGVSVQGSF